MPATIALITTKNKKEEYFPDAEDALNGAAREIAAQFYYMVTVFSDYYEACLTIYT